MSRLVQPLCDTIPQLASRLSRSSPIVQAYSQIELRICISLLSRFAIPLHSLLLVFRCTDAVAQADSQVELCSCIALFSRFAIPFHSLLLVFRCTDAVGQEGSEIELCFALALF